MWSSEDTASRLFNLANIGLIFSLALGVVSTALVVWMGNVKESYARRELAQTQGEAAAANEKASKANERAANLENENLKLQERIAQTGHRNVMLLGSQVEFADSLKPFAGQRFELGICPVFQKDWEVFELQSVIKYTLSRMAGWVPEPDRTIGVCSTGIGIFVRSTGSSRTREAAQVLSKNLNKILGKYEIGGTPAAQVGLAVTGQPKPPAVMGEESSAPETILIVLGAHP